jgi:hypothetical protein
LIPGPFATKARMALAILIWLRFFSETLETRSLDDFKQVVEEFLASVLRRMKVVETFTECSMMQVSSGEDLWGIPLLFCLYHISDPFN